MDKTLEQAESKRYTAADKKRQQKRLVLSKHALLYGLVPHSMKILTKPPSHTRIILSRANPVKHDRVLLDTTSSNSRGLLSEKVPNLSVQLLFLTTRKPHTNH